MRKRHPSEPSQPFKLGWEKHIVCKENASSFWWMKLLSRHATWQAEWRLDFRHSLPLAWRLWGRWIRREKRPRWMGSGEIRELPRGSLSLEVSGVESWKCSVSRSDRKAFDREKSNILLSPTLPSPGRVTYLPTITHSLVLPSPSHHPHTHPFIVQSLPNPCVSALWTRPSSGSPEVAQSRSLHTLQERETEVVKSSRPQGLPRDTNNRH